MGLLKVDDLVLVAVGEAELGAKAAGMKERNEGGDLGIDVAGTEVVAGVGLAHSWGVWFSSLRCLCRECGEQFY